MNAKKPTEEDLNKARKFFPKGSTVYLIIRSAARSGMSRSIGIVVLGIARLGGPDDQPCVIAHPNHLVAEILGRRVNKDGDGVICHGGGMDMGFELVYSLAQVLYGDGYALSREWL